MTINTFFRTPGDVADAASETNLQNEIFTETLALGSDNIRTEGLNRIHFQPQPSDVTTTSATIDNGVGFVGVYNSDAWTPVAHGSPMLLDFGASGFTVQPGWVVRFQWSLLVTDFERAGNLGTYAFALQADLLGAGVFIQQSPSYWYSAMAYPRDGPSTSTYWPMTNRRHTMSYTMMSSTPFTIFDARVVTRIEAPWEMSIRYTNLFALVHRH